MSESEHFAEQISVPGGSHQSLRADEHHQYSPSEVGRHFKQTSELDGTTPDPVRASTPKPLLKAASDVPAQEEPLRRVKKRRRHPVLNIVGIGCGSLLAVFLVFVAIVAVWFGALNSSMGIDDEQERQDLEDALVEPVARDESFYVLILGRDARPGEDASRSDVNMLARIDPATGTVTLVSIPRDTMVTINGSTQKINAANAFAGAAGAVRCVSQFAGVNISHFVSIDFDGLVEVVDMLGGIWIDVPEAFSTGGYSFQEGEQLLTGEQALVFVRERHQVSGGDFGRAQAQRLVVEAILRQVLESSPINLPGVITQLVGCINTDLSASQLIEYGQQFLGKNLTVYSAICPSYTLWQDGTSYVGTMFDEWRRMMQLTDAGLDPNSVTAEIPDEQRENEELGAASNSPAPRDYEQRAQNAMTTDDVKSTS